MIFASRKRRGRKNISYLALPPLSIPAPAGNSAKRKCNVACGDAWRTMPPREIPAFAGMEEGAGMERSARTLFLPLTKKHCIGGAGKVYTLRKSRAGGMAGGGEGREIG